MAVLSPHHLTVVEASTGRHWRLSRPGERVASFAWRTNDEIAYAAFTNISGQNGNIADKTFWRQDVHDTKTRTLVYRKTATGWSKDYWSPKGRHVLFAVPDADQYVLLNVPAGAVQVFDGVLSRYGGMVSWKPDGTAAFCLVRGAGSSEEYRALLIEAETGKAHDCGRQIEELCSGDIFSVGLQPLWTCDGKYVLANVTYTGGHLIQPVPWRTIPIGRLVAERFKEETERHPCELERCPYAYRLPFPGRVAVAGYVTDYQGVPLSRLPGMPPYPGPGSFSGYAVSANGKIARLGYRAGSQGPSIEVLNAEGTAKTK